MIDILFIHSLPRYGPLYTLDCAISSDVYYAIACESTHGIVFFLLERKQSAVELNS